MKFILQDTTGCLMIREFPEKILTIELSKFLETSLK